MNVTISKWGNSLGLRIPNLCAQALSIKDGDTVNIELKGNAFQVAKPTKKTAKSIIEQFYGTSYDKAVEIAAASPRDTELDWGGDVGEEVIP